MPVRHEEQVLEHMTDEIREPGNPQPPADGRSSNVEKAASGKYDWDHEDRAEFERRDRRRAPRQAKAVPGSFSWFLGLWRSLVASLRRDNREGFGGDDDDASPSAA